MTRARYDFEISSCRKQLQDARGVVAREKAQEELQAMETARAHAMEGLESKASHACSTPFDAPTSPPASRGHSAPPSSHSGRNHADDGR